MYAIVEFLKGRNKEFAVVPILWLCDNNKTCYWPRVKTEMELVKFVQQNSSHDKKWPKYAVNKVWKSSEDYNSLQEELTQILEQSSAESGSSAIQITQITDKPSHEQEADSEHDYSVEIAHNKTSKNKGHKRKYKSDNHGNKKSYPSKLKSPVKHQNSSSSSQSSETDNNDTVDENETESLMVNKTYLMHRNHTSSPNVTPHRATGVLRNITNKEAVTAGLTNSPLHRSPIIQRSITGLETMGAWLASDHQVSEERSSRESPALAETPTSTGSRRFRFLSRADFQFEVMTHLRTLDNELSQINTSLGQLARSSRFGNVQAATKPDGFPNLPIATMEDFRSFDALLKREVFETYFTNRLAAIGGINVRQSVMNILKFALTNKVAMEFNWAGRDKKQPFQGTIVAKIITAAVKICFTDSPDATDTRISSAIKDWLKQAKHRHACQQKRDT